MRDLGQEYSRCLIKMTDKKNPQPFNSSLFSSPGGSGGLSLGFDEPFSSPFSLAPALSTSSSSKQSDDGTIDVWEHSTLCIDVNCG